MRTISTLILSAAASLSALSALAQSPVITADPDPRVRTLPPFRTAPAVVVNVRDIKEDWQPSLKNTRVIHEPGMDKNRDFVQAQKAEANRLRAAAAGQSLPAPAQKTNAVLPPTQGVAVIANPPDGLPNDNDIAVSAAGKVVSVSNTLIYMYEETGGAPIANMSLDAFCSQGGFPASFKFDPVANYDPVNDRFLVVLLSGASSSNSKIIVCASQTNDPTGNWYVYNFTGNPIGGVWTDFPQTGLSSQEFFITGNLFDNNDSYVSTEIWQIPLTDLYSGGPLNVTTHNTPYFSMHPVEGGSTLYGPHFYFLSNENGGSSRDFRLHVMTNTAAANGVLNAPLSFQSNITYSIAPDAGQPNTTTDLATNDCRIQNSYYQNNHIYFTLNTGFNTRAAVYVGKAQLSPFNLSFSAFSGYILADDQRDLAYGSVCYAGQDGNGNLSYVAFNYAGDAHNPGNGVVMMDGLSEFSPLLITRQGVGPMMFGGNPMRWGDYADIQTRHNNIGEAWMTGSFGGTNGTYRTSLTQILPPTPVSNTPAVTAAAQPELTVYPNPTTDLIRMDFDVVNAGMYKFVVYDMQGRMVRLLMEDYLRPGTARASFSTQHLAAGTYILRVESPAEKLISKEIQVVK